MNANQIIDALGDARDDFVKDAGTSRRGRTLRRLAAAAIFAALCLALMVPAVAWSPTGYRIMYALYPQVAQALKPVRESCEVNDVRMEVVSAVIEDNTAYIEIGIQDLKGGLLDGSIDLNDSYEINRGFAAAGSCTKLGYNEQTRTVTYLIQLSPLSGTELTGGKVTFSVGQICGFTQDWEGPIQGVALVPSGTEPQTRSANAYRFDEKTQQSLSVTYNCLPLCDDAIVTPVEHALITGVDFIDGQLHVQVYFNPIDDGGANGFLYLKDANGEPVYGDHISTHNQECTGRYDEYIFDVTPEQAESCTLWGWLYSMSEPMEGPWSVTFPLTPANP